MSNFYDPDLHFHLLKKKQRLLLESPPKYIGKCFPKESDLLYRFDQIVFDFLFFLETKKLIQLLELYFNNRISKEILKLRFFKLQIRTLQLYNDVRDWQNPVNKLTELKVFPLTSNSVTGVYFNNYIAEIIIPFSYALQAHQHSFTDPIDYEDLIFLNDYEEDLKNELIEIKTKIGQFYQENRHKILK